MRAPAKPALGILDSIDAASPIMRGRCDEWRNLTLTEGHTRLGIEHSRNAVGMRSWSKILSFRVIRKTSTRLHG